MTAIISSFYRYRDLIATLVWKGVVLRYKQAYLGLVWSVAKPIMLMLIFSLMRVFIGIDSGGLPYPVLAYSALTPWMFFQESASDGVGSVVNNAHLIRKIYFPRAVFPLTAVGTKLVDFLINLIILVALMAWYGIFLNAHALWVPILVLYTALVALALALLGAAVNVYYRDIAQLLPLLLSLLMYASPVIYPLQLVQQKLLEQRAAGDWSEFMYTLYLANPLAGIIDAFQRVLIKGLPPDPSSILPGLILVAGMLPLSYAWFKRAESDFADVI